MQILPIEIDQHILSFLDIKDIYRYHIHLNNNINIFTQYIKYKLKRFVELYENINHINWDIFSHKKMNHEKSFTSYVFSLFESDNGCKILYTGKNNKYYLIIKENTNKIIWIEPRINGFYIQNFYKSLYDKNMTYAENETIDSVKEKIEKIMCV